MPMNATGAGLKQLSESMAFGSEQCILVFDDLDLPLGAVKTLSLIHIFSTAVPVAGSEAMSLPFSSAMASRG